MTDWKLIGLMAYVVAAVLVGTFLLCFAIDFVGDEWEIHDYTVDWHKAVIGLALLLSAGLIAHGWAQ